MAVTLCQSVDRLGLVVPDGVQHLEHVGAGDVIDRQVHQRLGVAVQRVEPFTGVALAAPARRVEGMHRGGGAGERRHAGDPLGGVGHRAAVDELGTGPQLGGAPTGLGEADRWVGAEPDVAALAVRDHPGHPRAAARRLDHQREPAAVGVLARSCAPDFGGAESAWLCHVCASRVPHCAPRIWGTRRRSGNKSDANDALHAPSICDFGNSSSRPAQRCEERGEKEP